MDHKPAAGAEDGEEAEVEEDGEGGMEVEGKARQRKGKAAKRMSAAPRSVQVDLRVVPASQRLRELAVSRAGARSFSGTPQLDVLVQLLTAAAADAKYLQNHSKAVVEQFMLFLARQYDPLFSEDQEALEDDDLALLGYAPERALKTSHATLKAAGKKSGYVDVSALAKLPDGGEEGGGGSIGSRGSRGAVLQVVRELEDEQALVRMGRTDATRVLLGFLEIFAGMTSAEPLVHREVLRKVFTALLVKTHNQVQLLALCCLCLTRDWFVVCDWVVCCLFCIPGATARPALPLPLEARSDHAIQGQPRAPHRGREVPRRAHLLQRRRAGGAGNSQPSTLDPKPSSPAAVCALSQVRSCPLSDPMCTLSLTGPSHSLLQLRPLSDPVLTPFAS